jgi:hypothetical protein
MSDIKPSEQELKAAHAIGGVAGCSPSEINLARASGRLGVVAAIIAAHTRSNGETAQALRVQLETAEARVKELKTIVPTEFLGKPVSYWATLQTLAERQMLNYEGTISRIAELEARQRKAQAEALRWAADRMADGVTGKSLLYLQADAIECGEVTTHNPQEK